MLESCHGALWVDRLITTAWGLFGTGAEAGPVNTITIPDGTKKHPLKMRARAREMPAGNIVDTRMGGCGGFGDSGLRAKSQVPRDVRQGLVSATAILSQYGAKFWVADSVLFGALSADGNLASNPSQINSRHDGAKLSRNPETHAHTFSRNSRNEFR